jgi:hypothetical protein
MFVQTVISHCIASASVRAVRTGVFSMSAAKKAAAADDDSDVDVARAHRHQWERHRNAAQLILGSFGLHVLGVLPAAIRRMLEQQPGGSKHAGRSAFALALALHDRCANKLDAIKSVSEPYPIGVDVVYMRRILRHASEVAEKTTDMAEQARLLVKAIGDEHRLPPAVASAALLVQPGREGCAQIAFAYAFSTATPSARVAEDLLRMSETDCHKTLSTASSELVQRRCVHAHDLPELAPAELEQRLGSLAARSPQVFLCALHDLRLMGPAFFEAGDKPFGLTQPLPLEYARHIERTFTSQPV